MNDTASTPRPLRILLIEDNPDDALLLMHALAKGGFAPVPTRVATPDAMREALDSGSWDIIISDYSLPEFSGLQALDMARQHDPDLPFIVVSGNIGEDVAVRAMRAGAQDYVLKHNLTRLAPVVAREVDETAERRSRRETRDELSRQQARMYSILNALGHIVWSIELPAARIEYMNPAAEAIYGCSVGVLLGDLEQWLERVHPDDRARMREYVGNTLAAGTNSAEYRIVRPDGSVRWLFDRSQVIEASDGRKLRIDGVASDITRTKESQELLYRAAHHDALTDLPNRKLILERMHHELARLGREGGVLALMLIDIDRFKTINDSLGHEAGDSMLCEVAGRISGCLRNEDTVARLGGDEFAVLLPAVGDEGGAHTVAQKVAYALAPPMQVNGQTIHCTASLGIVLYPRDGTDPETLMMNADIAMYAAKHAGRNACRFYTPEMNAASARLLDIENALRGALERGEFEVHYQPQIDLVHDGSIYGFEALLRWRRPEIGLVLPSEFIPLAEETGLIVAIGKWVLHEACRQARIWVDRFDPALRVAVNLSARQFSEPGLAAAVAAALQASDLPARNLELELTESMIMQDPAQSGRTLAELKAMGVTIAVDDFGTGYSSLAYLRRFPIDILKIDKSFVGELTSNPEDAAICASIIAMAHTLRLKVVAEGIETDGQLGFLTQRGCDCAQGFLLGHPLPADSAADLLQGGGGHALANAARSNGERTLLLVDDDALILTALKRLLRNDGYRILAAESPEEAFELLAANRVGVTISDQRMPGMTGTEFLRHVKDLYPNIVRIMLSGYTELDSVIASVNAGAIHRFLTKPWEENTLRTTIREAFNHHELHRANALLDQQYREAHARVAELEKEVRTLHARLAEVGTSPIASRDTPGT